MVMNSFRKRDFMLNFCFLTPTLGEGPGSNFLGANLDSFEAN